MDEGVMEKLRGLLLGLPRRTKRLIQVATDVFVVWVALWLAFAVRLGLDEMINPLIFHFWLFFSGTGCGHPSVYPIWNVPSCYALFWQ